ncbi:MAG TPA: CDP-diacylglycerol--serine O-phosphatidyltransferase [Gemmatimonadaceae bacterium]|nr:CDP-diacylglycerol--serine O-phosphatidyltransferase [Gemmatimonadaceae bacterium]
MRPVLPRPAMRRAVVLLPNGFTLGNLLFGVWAIVLASRGDYSQASWMVVFGGIMDALDGRVARMTKTGSAFGVELDSLVDAITFGVAPAFIIYFAVLNQEGSAWLYSFFFIAAAVMRLARFNVEQGGRAKTSFHGLPSPAAGITLASYVWFSQSPLYDMVAIPGVPWHEAMRWVMLLLAFLMISHVLYPAITNIGVRSASQITQLLVVLTGMSILIFRVEEYLFPALALYVVYGLARTVLLGVVDRLPTGDPLYDPDDDEDEDESLARPVSVGEVPGTWRHRRRRRGRREHPQTDNSPDSLE